MLSPFRSGNRRIDIRELFAIFVEMLEDIKSNIEKLIALYESEKQRSDALAAELERCRADIAVWKEKAQDLDGQIDNLKLQYAFSGAGDPALAKERITKLIREIDRCIKLLEK